MMSNSDDKSGSNYTDEISSHTSPMSSYITSLDTLSSFADFYDKARLAASRNACGIRDSTNTDEPLPPERSASVNCRSVDDRDPPDVLSSTEDRTTLACNRLYRTGIYKERMKAQNLKEANTERSASTSAADYRNSLNSPLDVTCNRLYKVGVQKEKVKAQYLKDAKKVMEGVSGGPSKLDISTRSYTPLKARPYERKIAALGDYSTVHNYLFYLSKDKQAEAAREAERENSNVDVGKILSTREKQKIVHRLYERSKSTQHAGRERRERIATAIAPKPQAPRKMISQDKATAFFDRQMAHKAAHEKKILDAQVNRPPRAKGVEPFLDLNGDRAPTPVRGRSMTPDRVRPNTRVPIAPRARSCLRSRTPTGVRSNNTPSIGRAQSQDRRNSLENLPKAPLYVSLKPQTRSASPGRNFRALPN